VSKIVLSELAETDLTEIWAFVAEDNVDTVPLRYAAIN
jgi:hypothetical protein